jgi:hypothetical protein
LPSATHASHGKFVSRRSTRTAGDGDFGGGPRTGCPAAHVELTGWHHDISDNQDNREKLAGPGAAAVWAAPVALPANNNQKQKI